MSKLKSLKLTEDEKELAQEFFFASEGFKLVTKILTALVAAKQEAALSRYVDLKNKSSQEDFIADKVAIQGMQSLVKEFELLKNESIK